MKGRKGRIVAGFAGTRCGVEGWNPTGAQRHTAACELAVVLWVMAYLSPAAGPVHLTRGTETARRFGVHEIILTGREGLANPFDSDATVTFTSRSGTKRTVKAFYDGGSTWRARLYVGETGRWTWLSESVDDELNGERGEFTAAPSNLRGKLRPHPANQRWWVTDDGRTFLNVADTAYILFRSSNDPVQPVTDATFRQYVKANVRLGITSMRAGGCGGYAGWSRHVPGVSKAYNRSNWCWEKDYTPNGSNDYWDRFDLERFQTTDRRLEWLLNTYPDMYIQLVMGSKDGRKWFEIPERYRRRTVEYMIARWSAWPQVFYQIVNDTRYTGRGGEVNRAMVREIAAYMAELEPFGTLRSAGAKRDAENPFTLESDWRWHTYLHTQETTEVDAHVCDHYYGETNVPVHVYHGEDIYEQDTRSVEAALRDPRYFFRRLFWSVLLSGGTPTYGGRYPVLHPYDRTEDLEFRLQKSRLVFDAPLVGLDHIIHIREFFQRRGIDLGLFAPDDAAAAVIPTPRPEPNGPSRAQCARRGHDEYLIYLPCAGNGERSGGGGGSKEQRSRGSSTVDTSRTPGLRVDLREASGGFQVEWYRPTDGTSRRGPIVQGGEFRTLTSPWQGADVVVRLLRDRPPRLAPSDVVALKAGRGENPPWTLYGYERNLRAGVSLDMDIRKTADGDIVVLHDETTGRTCEKNWVVVERSVAELKTLDAAWHFDPRGERSFPLRGKGLTIPTLDEALALFVQKKQPGAIVWIDTKDDEDHPLGENQRLYDRLVELIAGYNLWDEAHVEVSSVNEADALRSRDVRVRVVFWSGERDEIKGALDYPHFVRIGVPHRLAASMADDVKAAGKKLHVTDRRFTAREWNELRSIGPDSLGTENYSQLLEWLQTTK